MHISIWTHANQHMDTCQTMSKNSELEEISSFSNVPGIFCLNVFHRCLIIFLFSRPLVLACVTLRGSSSSVSEESENTLSKSSSSSSVSSSSSCESSSSQRMDTCESAYEHMRISIWIHANQHMDTC